MALQWHIKPFSRHPSFFCLPFWHITSSLVSQLFHFSPSCPPVIQSFILSLPYFSSHFPELSFAPLSLSFCLSFILWYAPRPPPHFPSASLLFIKPSSALWFCCIATVCLSITLLPFHFIHSVKFLTLSISVFFSLAPLPTPYLSLYFNVHLFNLLPQVLFPPFSFSVLSPSLWFLCFLSVRPERWTRNRWCWPLVQQTFINEQLNTFFFYCCSMCERTGK